jgi:predicted nucleotidyltransferase
MSSHEEICNAIAHIVSLFPVKKASYFGAYAEGTQSVNSDLDLLLEFHNTSVSLEMISTIKTELESILTIPVEVIHAPLAEDTLLKTARVVRVFG